MNQKLGRQSSSARSATTSVTATRDAPLHIMLRMWVEQQLHKPQPLVATMEVDVDVVVATMHDSYERSVAIFELIFLLICGNVL